MVAVEQIGAVCFNKENSRSESDTFRYEARRLSAGSRVLVPIKWMKPVRLVRVFQPGVITIAVTVLKTRS